ncbi:hypothetical protein MMC25_001877 [Agyrium rufum]|nr:hypothetical protein [Agyrium rufum]
MNSSRKRTESQVPPLSVLGRPHYTDCSDIQQDSIASLSIFLYSIRQSYLTTTQPPRRRGGQRHDSFPHDQSTSHNSDPHDAAAATSQKDQSRNSPRPHISNMQKDQIDAESKTALREANASIRQLADAELLRQRTEQRIAQEKRNKNRGFRALSSWAAGGIVGGQQPAKSPEEELEDARQNTLRSHREGVIWFLDWRLGEAASVQRDMMQARLEREMEKSKSVLYKTRGVGGVAGLGLLGEDFGAGSDDGGVGMSGSMGGGLPGQPTANRGGGRAAKAAAEEEEQRHQALQQLSPEQMQMFAKENSDMLRQYEDSLDQVRTAERSIQEIAELHTTLTQNLTIQSEHIGQLVMDSVSTAENLQGGNKELKRATERKSTARLVFYASCGFSAFLIVWDLIF